MKPGDTIYAPSVHRLQVLRHPEHDRPFRVIDVAWTMESSAVLHVVGCDDRLSVLNLTIPTNVPLELIARPTDPYEPETILAEEKK